MKSANACVLFVSNCIFILDAGLKAFNMYIFSMYFTFMLA